MRQTPRELVSWLGKLNGMKRACKKSFVKFFMLKKKTKARDWKEAWFNPKQLRPKHLGLPLWLSCLGCLFLFQSNHQQTKCQTWIYGMKGYCMNYLLCSALCDCKQEMNLGKNEENDIYVKTLGGCNPRKQRSKQDWHGIQDLQNGSSFEPQGSW